MTIYQIFIFRYSTVLSLITAKNPERLHGVGGHPSGPLGTIRGGVQWNITE